MSRLSDLLDIEPLGKDREQAIKARVFAQLDRERAVAEAAHARPGQRRRWPLALGLAAVAAAVVLMLVFAVRDDSERSGRVATATRLTTDKEPSVFDVDGARLGAAPNSALVVNRDGQDGTWIELERGAVTCEVAPRAGRPPFRIRAGEVEVAVVGTAFTVRREGDAARVDVTRGVVELRYRGATRRLSAGESWAPGVIAVETEAPTDPDTAAEAPEREPDAPAAPERARVRPRSDRPADKPADKPANKPMDRPRTRPAGKTGTPGARPPAKERYETAARLERTDPERSMELYAELVADGGAWAATALFAQGRLEYERGHTGKARKLLERYLRSHGTGANAEVARKLLEELEE